LLEVESAILDSEELVTPL